MPVNNPPQFRPKAAVSVTGMAKAIGLSRSRFYDYVRRGVFPWPIYSVATRRPFYTGEMQEDILEARQSGIGCNGEYVLFYERRPVTPAPATAPKRTSHSGLIEGLKSLGMTNVTTAQVEAALTSAFPGGVAGQDETSVLRAVYRQLRRAIGGG